MAKNSKVRAIDTYHYPDTYPPRISFSISRHFTPPGSTTSFAYSRAHLFYPGYDRNKKSDNLPYRPISLASVKRLNNALAGLYEDRRTEGYTWYSETDCTLNGVTIIHDTAPPA